MHLDPVPPSELDRVRHEHGNIAQLLLVLESHLALMSAGDGGDLGLMRDAVGYLADYVGRFHRVREDLLVEAAALRQPELRACVTLLGAQHDAVEADGARLHERLGRALLGDAVDRRELVRLGFLYCTELRRHMSLEEATLEGAAVDAPVSRRGTRDGEEHYRALFEELTRRVGCDCAYSRSS